MAQFQASPVALLSETGSGGGTPPCNLPPRVLNKDLVFYNLTRIRMYDVTVDKPPENSAASNDGIRSVQRVFAYKKGQAKWVYSSKVPYAFLGRLVDGHDFIPLDYNKHFGIVEQEILPPPLSPQLERQDSTSSSKSTRTSEEEEEEVCLLCMEPYSSKSNTQEQPMEQEFFDKLPFVIGVCGHKMCRLCWRKNSSMVVNNAAPGYPDLNVLCDAVCPFCKGDIDMVSKDRENIVRQWQDEEENIDIDDFGESEDEDEEDTIPERDLEQGPLCGLCRQPGHNRRTCPLRQEHTNEE